MVKALNMSEVELIRKYYQSLPHKDDIALFFCNFSEFLQNIFRGTMDIIQLRGNYLPIGKKPGKSVIILIVGFSKKAVQIQYFHRSLHMQNYP